MLPPEPAFTGRQDEDVVELVDAELVSAEPRRDDDALSSGRADVRDIARRKPAVVVATAAAVVGTGFVAGALATAVVSGKVAAGRRRRDARRLPPVVGSRRFLVDVHLLGDR